MRPSTICVELSTASCTGNEGGGARFRQNEELAWYSLKRHLLPGPVDATLTSRDPWTCQLEIEEGDGDQK